MQPNLELRFDIRIRLVARITFPTSGSRDGTFGVGVLDGQFAPFFQ
jgi:hypothetical protein